MTDLTLNPELLAAARSNDHARVSSMLGSNKSLGASASLLSIDSIRSAVITNDEKSVAALLTMAAGTQDPKMLAYSAERAWRVTQSYLREGQERKAMMLLSAMPVSFTTSNRGRDRDEALALSSHLHMRPASATLLDCGASPTFKDPQGMTALMHFARNGDPQMLAESLRQLELNKPGGALKALEIKDETGWTVGMYAVTSQASELSKRKAMEALADSGFQFGQPQGSEGFTELHMAAGLGDVASIHQLVSVHHVDANVRSTKQMTPLMVASYANQGESIKVLAGLGADPNIRRGSDGFSAGHIAAARGGAEALRALNAAGANLRLPTWDSQEFEGTALTLAKSLGQKAAARLIDELQPQAVRKASDQMAVRLSDLLAPLKKTARTMGLGR